MWFEPSKERLDAIPKLYETEQIPSEEKIMHLYFHLGKSHWFVCEYDGEDKFFGFAVLNNDYINAEWGYCSYSELKEMKIGYIEVECEDPKCFKPTPAKQIDIICRCLNKGW